jgi:hypothetical protein
VPAVLQRTSADAFALVIQLLISLTYICSSRSHTIAHLAHIHLLRSAPQRRGLGFRVGADVGVGAGGVAHIQFRCFAAAALNPKP